MQPNMLRRWLCQAPWIARVASSSTLSLPAACRALATSADVEQSMGTEDTRESMHFDLLIVGAGPAGLSAAIRFKQVGACRCGRCCQADRKTGGLRQRQAAAQQCESDHEAEPTHVLSPCSCARRRARIIACA